MDTVRQNHRIAGVTHGRQTAHLKLKRDPYVTYVSGHPPAIRNCLIHSQPPSGILRS